MADRSNNGSAKVTFREKAARVHGPKDHFTSNSSISIDRDFTVKFTDAERAELDEERSNVRNRLTGTGR